METTKSIPEMDDANLALNSALKFPNTTKSNR